MALNSQLDELTLAKKAVELRLITSQHLEKVIQLQETFRKELNLKKNISDLLIERNYISKAAWEKHVATLCPSAYEDEQSAMLEVIEDAKTSKLETLNELLEEVQPNEDTTNMATIASEPILDVIEEDGNEVAPGDVTLPLNVVTDTSNKDDDEAGSKVETMVVYHEILNRTKLNQLLPQPSSPPAPISLPSSLSSPLAQPSSPPTQPLFPPTAQGTVNIVSVDNLLHEPTNEHTTSLSSPTAVSSTPTALPSVVSDVANPPDERRITTNSARIPTKLKSLAQPENIVPDIAGYTIVKKIGEGAMGTVYRGIQKSTKCEVAIKVLDKKISKDPNLLERFERERQMMIRLKHKNLVAALETGNTREGIPFFVMEFVNGKSLGTMLEQGKLPLDKVLDYTIQIAYALDYANHEHIIHRDIKPENILVTQDGVAKLCDLGLVREIGQQSNLTLAGYAIGTPQYISPEQALGESNVDIRSDIYSLGASLYHMVTGQVPFPNQNPTVVCTLHVNQPLPNPCTINPDVPQEICNIIQRCTEKRREDRYQTPSFLIKDLEKCQQAMKNGKLHRGLVDTSKRTLESQDNVTNMRHSGTLSKPQSALFPTSHKNSKRIEKVKATPKSKAPTPKGMALPDLLPVEANEHIVENLYDTSEMRRPHHLETATMPRTLPRRPHSPSSSSPSSSAIKTNQTNKTPKIIYIVVFSLIFFLSGVIVYWFASPTPNPNSNTPNPNEHTSTNHTPEPLDQMILQLLQAQIIQIERQDTDLPILERLKKREQALENIIKQHQENTKVQEYLETVKQTWQQDVERELEKLAAKRQSQYVSMKKETSGAKICEFYNILQADCKAYKESNIYPSLETTRSQVAILIQERHNKDLPILQSLYTECKWKEAIDKCQEMFDYIPVERTEKILNDCFAETQRLQDNILQSRKKEQINFEKDYFPIISEKIARAMCERNLSVALDVEQPYRQYVLLHPILDEYKERIKMTEEIIQSLPYSIEKPPSESSVKSALNVRYKDLSPQKQMWVLANIFLYFQQWQLAKKYFSTYEPAIEKNFYLIFIQGKLDQVDAEKYAQEAESAYQEAELAYKGRKYNLAYERYLTSIQKLDTIINKLQATQYTQQNKPELDIKFQTRISQYLKTFAVALYFEQKFKTIPVVDNLYSFQIGYSFDSENELNDFVIFPNDPPQEIILDSSISTPSTNTPISKTHHIQYNGGKMYVSFDGRKPTGLFEMYWKGRTIGGKIEVSLQQYQHPLCNIGIIVNKYNPTWQYLESFLCLAYFDWDKMRYAETVSRKLPPPTQKQLEPDSKAPLAILVTDYRTKPSTLVNRQSARVVKDKGVVPLLKSEKLTLTATATNKSSNNSIEFASQEKCTTPNSIYRSGHIGLYSNSPVIFDNLTIHGTFEEKWVAKIIQHVQSNQTLYISKILKK